MAKTKVAQGYSLQDDAQYAREFDLYREIGQQLRAVIERREELRERWQGERRAGGLLEGAEDEGFELADRVEALAGRDDAVAELEEELRRLARRQASLERAQAEAAERLRRVKAEAIERQYAAAEPEHRSLLEAFAKAAVALGQAADAEAHFRARLSRGGVNKWDRTGPGGPVAAHLRLDQASVLTDCLDRIERDFGIRVDRPEPAR